MPETTQIEIASLNDYEELTELFLASYPTLMKEENGSPGYSKEELELALPLIAVPNRGLLSSNTFYVIRDGSGPIKACGGWTLERPGDGNVEDNVAHIRHFATHPDTIRKGYGRKIIHHCIEQARRTDCVSIECFSSLNAEAFYSAMGFKREKAVTLNLRDGILFSAILMKLEL